MKSIKDNLFSTGDFCLFGRGQELTFNNDFFFFDNLETVYLDNVAYGEGAVNLIREVIDDRGHNSLKDFLEWNNYTAPLNKLKILLFVKQKGRSHAYNNLKLESVDIAIVYFQSQFGMATDQYVVSHEILHHFGAWDLYKGKSQSLESAKKAKELYPYSVMINTYRNKDQLIVDELTAWRVGWGEAKKEYFQFDPRKNSQKMMEAKKKKEGFSIKFDLAKKKKN